MNRKGVTPVIATSLLIGIALSTALTASVFMQNSLNDVQQGFEDDLQDEELEDKSDLSIQYGYDQGGYILLELRNSGSVALPLDRDGTRLISLYISGRPEEDWSYLSPRSQLGVGTTITMNTTRTFPDSGDYTEIEVRGPRDTSSSIVCYNDGSPSC